ncbi:hypothetical protein [Cetobacterium ceti]
MRIKMESIVKILDTNKYSINIQDDYTDQKKIDNYYPTYRNLKLLNKFLEMIYENKSMSVLLSGAYGTGKSYFTAVLLNILKDFYKKENYKIFLEKSEKIYSLNKILEKNKNKKYFIVFLDDSIDDFSKALFQGINQSAKRDKIKLNLVTKYEIIKIKIEKWEKNYKETYNKFLDTLDDTQEFFELLEENNEKSIDIFLKSYTEIFSGEKFLFFEKPQKIENLLKEVEKEIKEKGYDGIIYIFDEFGRYLETNIKKIDVKDIQDMSEYCNNENASSLLMITHKDIFQYTNRLGNSILKDEWEKVSGRFLKEHLIYEKINVLEILENIIETSNYKEYRKNNLKCFNRKERLLKKIEVTENNIEEEISRFYPLDYMTAMLLPDFSQKFAQNERTLFSFICGMEEKSLKNILYKSKDEFIGLDRIFDYFEDNFRRLSFDTQEYKIYINTKNILQNIPKKDKKIRKFVKTLGIIWIYNKFNELKPTPEVMKYLMNLEDIKEIESYLKDKNYIQYRRYNNYYKLSEDIDINIEKDVKEYIDKSLNNFDYMETLNRFLSKEIYYPLKYNDKQKINRYMGQYFMDISKIDLDKIKNNKYEDGKIVFLINIMDNPNYMEILEHLKNEDMIIIYNKIGEKLDILDELKELEGIYRLQLTNEKYLKEDVLRKEITSYKNEIIEKIKMLLDEYFINNRIYIKKIIDSDKYNLLDVTEEYLDKKYFNYIKVNYELINKQNISSPMKKVRGDILKKLLNKISLDEKYFNDTKAESSVARILLYNTKLYDKSLQIEKSIFQKILIEILEDIKKEKINLNKLYEKYCSNLNCYGLRKGIFTFLLGVIFINHMEEISITKINTGNEIELTINMIDIFEKNPENYEIAYFSLNKKEWDYMKSIEKLFQGHIPLNNEKIYNKILYGIKNYMLSIPRYILGIYSKKIPGIARAYKGIFTINNGKEFILVDLPKYYKSYDYKYIVETLEKELIEIDNCKKEFLKEIKSYINLTLQEDENIQFKDIILNLKGKKIKNNLEEFLYSLEGMSEEVILIEITKKIKGFSYENWRNEKDLEEFKSGLEKETKNKILCEDNINNNLKIFVNNRERNIDLTVKESVMGKLLKSKIESQIINMGKSISEKEKVKILAELLMNY